MKHLLLFSALGAVGARDAQAQAVPRDTNAVAVVRAYVQAYNAHDIDGMMAFLAPDFVWLSIVGDSVAVEARGHAVLRAQMADYFRRLPSARSEFEEITALGPWVSVHERAHWVSGTGPRSQASLSVYEVRGGVLQRVWYYPVVK